MDQSSQLVIANGQLSSRARLIKRASERTPVTAEDLPIGFYRIDLLPFTDQILPNDADDETKAEAQLREVQDLNAAFCELNYDQGFPTLNDGNPFWHKLDFEPGVAYAAFQIYLDQAEEGARELSELARNQELLNVLSQTSGLPEGETLKHNQVLSLLTEYATVYYWRSRSKAHDLFKEAAYRHLRIKRAMSAEDYHYRLSEKLLRTVETYLAKPDFEKDLTPKTAIEALKALVAIQRVSVGLPAAGPLPTKDTPESSQFEMILRQLGVQQASQSTAQGGANGGRQKSKALDSILQDAGTAKTMQELIIRVTTRNFDQDAEIDRPKGRTFENMGPTEDELVAEDVEFHRNVQ